MTAPWNTARIGELFDIGPGKSVTPAARHGDPKYPFLRTSNVFWGRIDLSEVDQMHFTDEELLTKTLRPGDLLVCEGGEIGRSAIWDGQIQTCAFQNHLHRLTPKSPDLVTLFFMYALQAGFTLLGRYDGAGNKVTIPNLSRNRLADLTVPCPQKPEQERIAYVLALAQRAAANHEHIVKLLQEQKNAMLRRLFEEGLRGSCTKDTDIGSLPEDWGVRPLEGMREFLQYGTSAKCDYHGKGRPVVRIPNVVDGRIDTADLKWCELSEREAAALELKSGDVIFIRTNGVRERVGTCGVYSGEPKDALFASYLIRARLKKDELDPLFFQYYSATERGRMQLAGRATPAADGKFNVNTKMIDSILVPVPSLDEQREIVVVLQANDSAIDAHLREHARLEELFNKLLHDLMTGEIRVDQLKLPTVEVSAA